MATYLRPGVFIEESLQPLTDPSLTSGDSVAAFVGTTPQGGPVGPTLVSSWTQYQALFGDIRSNRSDLSYALFQYFNNGGSQAYVVRGINTNAVAASLTVNDQVVGTPGPAFTVSSLSAGVWASDPTSKSRVFITVTAGGPGRFDLVIEVGSGLTLLAREQFVDLSLDPNDSRYAVGIVNSPTVGSKYVKLTSPVVTVNTGTGAGVPASQVKTPLTGGTDGTGTPDLLAAAQKLESLDINIDLNLPGVTGAVVLTDVINWAAARPNVFVVVDPPKAGASDDAATIATALTTFVNSIPAVSQRALYGPWVYINDPGSAVPGAIREVPPGGAVLGQYVYTDTFRSVSKAPAGIETSLRGVIETRARFSDAQLDALNPAGVNVIRMVPGNGFCIMGARTGATRTPDRYINVRRALMAVKRGIINNTRFAVYEPNNSALWEDIEAVVGQYLQTQFQLGVLAGNIEDEAFYVKCDEELNSADAVNAGVVKVEVGVALSSPAEFIVIRVGQYDNGSAVVEDDTAEEIV